MTGAQALEAIRLVLVSLVTPTVYLSYGDLPRPDAAHITLARIADLPQGFPEIDGTTATQLRQLRCQIDGYRADGVLAVERLATMLRSDDPRITIAVHQVGTVTESTAWWQTGYEPRATLEIRVGYERTESDAQTAAAVTRIDLDADSQESSISITDAGAP